MKFSAHIEEWQMKRPFRIAGVEWLTTRSLVVQLSAGSHIGRGEAQGVYYLEETADSLLAQVEAVANEIRQGLGRQDLQQVLPPGGARNALDCALWDLECKQSGKSIWHLTGIKPKAVTTVFTIGLEPTAAAMAENAAGATDAPILKVKLDSHHPFEKLAAIRAARPDARLVVDANQGWNFALLNELLPRFAGLGLEMIEQPLKRGDDAMLEGFASPIPLCADESCLHTGELETASRRYSMINIKLDKTGGLTEALNLAAAARAKGCKLMVGNMMGTSLSMVPTFVIAQLCDFMDLDGPLLLNHDHPNGLSYHKGVVTNAGAGIWGSGEC